MEVEFGWVGGVVVCKPMLCLTQLSSELHRIVNLTEYRIPNIFVHEEFPNTEYRIVFVHEKDPNTEYRIIFVHEILRIPNTE